MASNFAATDAAGYELLMGRWSRVLAPRFLDFVGIKPDGRTLDVGSGTGSLARSVAERLQTGALIGIDVAAPYVEHVQASNTDARLSFEVGDASALRFSDGEFDHTISLLVLNFIPEYRKAATEMVRVTRAGGTVAAAVWDFDGGLVMMRILWDTAAGLDLAASAQRGRVFSAPLTHEGELAALFRENGLVDVEERDLAIWMRFENFADFWTPFLSGQGTSGSYVSGLTEQQRDRLAEALLAAYCAGRTDGPRAFAAIARAAKGRVPP